MNQASNRTILLVGIVIELVLAVVFFVLAPIRGYSWSLFPNKSELLLGVVAVVPLCLFNFLVLHKFVGQFGYLKQIEEFVDQVIKPLADRLNVFEALALSIAAGVGEELFFRGVLQTETGLLISSLAFSLMHFGTAAIHYLSLVVIYFLIGLFLGLLFLYSSSIWPPIICHATYDFVALLYLRSCYRGKHTYF